MRWAESVRAVLPAVQADQVVSLVVAQWAGARVYLPVRTARLDWTDSGRQPRGADERLAADIAAAVRAAGGTRFDTNRILMSLAAKHLFL